ncbi:MAG: hypothetical protein ABI830_15165, partial [Pseudolabrys sp.]
TAGVCGVRAASRRGARLKNIFSYRPLNYVLLSSPVELRFRKLSPWSILNSAANLSLSYFHLRKTQLLDRRRLHEITGR